MWVLAAVAAIGWTVGTLFFGLWLGERGRRRAAEWVAGTAPRTPKPIHAVPDAEERILALDVDLPHAAKRAREMNPDLSEKEASAVAEYVTNYFAGGIP